MLHFRLSLLSIALAAIAARATSTGDRDAAAVAYSQLAPLNASRSPLPRSNTFGIDDVIDMYATPGGDYDDDEKTYGSHADRRYSLDRESSRYSSDDYDTGSDSASLRDLSSAEQCTATRVCLTKVPHPAAGMPASHSSTSEGVLTASDGTQFRFLMHSPEGQAVPLSSAASAPPSGRESSIVQTVPNTPSPEVLQGEFDADRQPPHSAPAGPGWSRFDVQQANPSELFAPLNALSGEQRDANLREVQMEILAAPLGGSAPMTPLERRDRRRGGANIAAEWSRSPESERLRQLDAERQSWATTMSPESARSSPYPPTPLTSVNGLSPLHVSHSPTGYHYRSLKRPMCPPPLDPEVASRYIDENEARREDGASHVPKDDFAQRLQHYHRVRAVSEAAPARGQGHSGKSDLHRFPGAAQSKDEQQQQQQYELYQRYLQQKQKQKQEQQQQSQQLPPVLRPRTSSTGALMSRFRKNKSSNDFVSGSSSGADTPPPPPPPVPTIPETARKANAPGSSRKRAKSLFSRSSKKTPSSAKISNPVPGTFVKYT